MRLRWGLFSLPFFLVCFGFFGLFVALRRAFFPRLLRDRAGKPRRKPQENCRKRSHLKPPRRRRAAPTRGYRRVSGLAVSMLLLSRSWWFLFLLVRLRRLRLQCLLRSSRSCSACLACGSRSERASRSMIARFYVGGVFRPGGAPRRAKTREDAPKSAREAIFWVLARACARSWLPGRFGKRFRLQE